MSGWTTSAHARAGLAVHQQHAGDRRGGGVRVELVELAQVGAERRCSISSSADLQAHAAPAAPARCRRRASRAPRRAPTRPAWPDDTCRCPGGARSRRCFSSRPSAVRSVPREIPSRADSSCSGGSRSPTRWRPVASQRRSASSATSTSEWRLLAAVLVTAVYGRAPFISWKRRSAPWHAAAWPQPIAALAPPARLLCGPGPTNVEPAALAAMGKPMLGHLDPAFHAILDEVVAMLAEVYRGARRLGVPAPEHRDVGDGGRHRQPGRAGRHGDRRRVRLLRRPHRGDRQAPRRERRRGGRGVGEARAERAAARRRSTATRARGWWPWSTARPPPASSTRSRSLARRCAAATRC